MELFFNEHEFRKATDEIQGNPERAIELLYEYSEKYPKDLAVGSFLAYTLLKVFRTEEAKEVIKYYQNKYKSSPKVSEIKDKLFVEQMKLNNIRVLIQEGNYRKALNYIKDNRYNTTDYNFLINVVFFLKSRVGYNNMVLNEPVGYLYSQILNYSEEEFLKHIEKHISGKTDIDVNENAIFNEDFPIEKVINEVKKYIPSDKRYYNNMFSNRYVFKYDFCGRNRGKITDYFSVNTFHNEDKIITMYPSENNEVFLTEDLNYLKEEKKVKRLSRIDSFNQRYNIK